MSLLFVCSISIFLAAAVISAVLATSGGKTLRQIALWSMLVGSALMLAVGVDVAINGAEVRVFLYRLATGLQFSFYVDRLAAFFLALVSFVSLAVIVYSMRYTEHHGTDGAKNFLLAMMSLFILSMFLVVASDNSFSFLFFWETMSIASFFLVMFERDKAETKKSALFYFVMTQMSTTFLLLGFLALYSVTGSFDITTVEGIDGLFKAGVFLALFVGFGTKAGVMPFHKWLPYAHSATPSNISALMSGVMIKVAIYGLARYLLFVLSPDNWWGVLVLAFGVVSALLGVIYALKEHDIKKLLAYHSIENIGIILMGLGMYLIFQSYGFPALALLALLGALFHTLNHALFKSLLFLTAGSVVDETGTRNIEEMGGMMKTMPWTGALFLIGSVSIAALPPFNGFVSELMIFQPFLQSYLIGNPLLRVFLFVSLSLFALTSALAAACFVKAFGVIFLAVPRSKDASEAKEVSRFMIVGPALLAAACAGLGVFSFQLFDSVGFQLPIPNLVVVGVFMAVAALLVLGLVRLTSNRKVRTSETWGCGIPSQDSSMEYTASGFSEPILTIFRPVYRTKKTVDRSYSDGSGAIFVNGSAEIHTFKIFEERLYLPVARFVHRVSNIVSDLHDVDLDTYILYSFLAVVVLILATGWLIK